LLALPPLPHPDATERTTVKAENGCFDWLCRQMDNGTQQPASKKTIWTQAKKTFGRLSRRAFDRAWARALEKTGNAEWGTPGPKNS
jgi:hypothetical protein